MPSLFPFPGFTVAQSWAFIIGLVYTIGVIIVRAHFIATPVRRFLQAQTAGIRARFTAERPANQKALCDQIENLLCEAERLNAFDRGGILSLILWNGSREIQGWRLAHEAEKLLVFILPAPAVCARLERAQVELERLPAPQRAHWNKFIAGYIAPQKPASKTDDEVRAALREFLSAQYEFTDSSFGQLVELQNKAMWLVWVGLILIAGIIVQGDLIAPLLLAGAIGGTLNRLRRIVQSMDSQTSYGAHWVPVFLSPIVGALTAWGGILLVQAGQSIGIFDLKGLALDQPNSPGTLALGLLFGFAEQFFDQITETLQNRVKASSTSAKDTSNASATN